MAEINITPDGKVKKVILREGTGDYPKDGQVVEGTQLLSCAC